MAPFPVDPSGGDSRGCARLGAGGTPALPASHHPMTSSQQGHKIAEAFWCRLWLKDVHLYLLVYSCLFVSIRGSSSLTIGRFSSNDPHGRAGARLIATLTPCTLLKSATPGEKCGLVESQDRRIRIRERNRPAWRETPGALGIQACFRGTLCREQTGGTSYPPGDRRRGLPPVPGDDAAAGHPPAGWENGSGGVLPPPPPGARAIPGDRRAWPNPLDGPGRAYREGWRSARRSALARVESCPPPGTPA